MFRRTWSNARFAAVLAVAVVVFTSGIVAGANGAAFIIGSSANSATATTKLNASVNGNAFAVSQTSSGASANGIRGDANTGTGGVFTSSSNNALFATAASANRFAMVAVSNGGAGTGGAIYANGNANPGLTVDVDSSSVPPLKVNSIGQVANLNGDLLDGYHANFLTRFAYNGIDNDARLGSAGFGTVISTSITAPTRGWLSITAGSDVFGSAGDVGSCNLDVDGTNIAASSRTFALGTSSAEEDCSTNAGYFVCPGTYPVALEGSVSSTSRFDEASIQVSFSPFDGAGNPGSIFSCLIILPSPAYTPGN